MLRRRFRDFRRRLLSGADRVDARLGEDDCLRDRDHFGVGCWVVKLLALVVGRGDYPLAAARRVIVNNDRADGHFVLSERGLGLAQRMLHVRFVLRRRFGKVERHRRAITIQAVQNAYSASFRAFARHKVKIRF